MRAAVSRRRSLAGSTPLYMTSMRSGQTPFSIMISRPSRQTAMILWSRGVKMRLITRQRAPERWVRWLVYTTRGAA